ncbi:MAG: OmpA family protein, partial [Verrucomicrobiota bacterium]
KMLLEGHCDERGTDGYNLALGERRALSVREELLNLGVESDRLQTITFGESRPADPGHDESAWSKNRRAEFILLNPAPGGVR